jgi:hypothetical protein
MYSRFSAVLRFSEASLSIRMMATVGDCLGFQLPSPLFLAAGLGA